MWLFGDTGVEIDQSATIMENIFEQDKMEMGATQVGAADSVSPSLQAAPLRSILIVVLTYCFSF